MSEKISDAIALLTRQVRPGGETFAQRAEGKDVNGSKSQRKSSQPNSKLVPAAMLINPLITTYLEMR